MDKIMTKPRRVLLIKAQIQLIVMSQVIVLMMKMSLEMTKNLRLLKWKASKKGSLLGEIRTFC